METTVLAVKSILSAAFDCALATTKSVLDEQNINYDRAELESKIRSKMNFVLDDSGVKANIMGKATTVDQALNGKIYSAMRNANWMTTQYTVARLDEDVNRLRMLLSAKNIDQKMRVLNACFKVKTDPGKSSSIITCSKLVKEKLKRGEIIEVDDAEEDKMEVDTTTIDWKSKFEDAKKKFQEKYNSWVAKARKVVDSVKSMQNTIMNQQAIINAFGEAQLRKELEYKNRLESIVTAIEWKLNSKDMDTNIKNEYLKELEAIVIIDANDGFMNIEEFIFKLLDDYADLTNLLRGLTSRFGLSLTIE